MRRRTGTGTGVNTGWESSPGSAVMFAMFACLVAATTVLALTSVVLSGERALLEEAEGREALSARDDCLAALREMSVVDWRATRWTPMEVRWGELLGRLVEIGEEQEWVLRAEVEQVPGTGSGLCRKDR